MRTKFDIYVFIKFTQKLYMVIIENIRLASHLWRCLFKFMASIFFGTLLFDQFPVALNITGYLNSEPRCWSAIQSIISKGPMTRQLSVYFLFFFIFLFLLVCVCVVSLGGGGGGGGGCVVVVFCLGNFCIHCI